MGQGTSVYGGNSESANSPQKHGILAGTYTENTVANRCEMLRGKKQYGADILEYREYYKIEKDIDDP